MIYVSVRVAGKWLGAIIGAVIMKSDKKIVTWLGPSLIPQAGVALGLSLAAQSIVPEEGAIIRSVILCATLIYELIGPGVTKWALTNAGEISKEN